jgi:hypothetical protein
MATNTREIETSKWTLITSSACSFQVLSERECKVTEASSKPDVDTVDYKIAMPKELYAFEPRDGKLYALAIDIPNAIAYDLT